MSNCSKSENVNKKCGNDLENMTAAEACDAVADSFKAMSDVIDSLGDWSPAGILKALGSSNKLSEKQRNVINNVQKTIQEANLTQSCTSSAVSTQLNVIEVTEECQKSREKMLEILKNNPEAQEKLIASWDITDIKQENVDTVVQQCTLSATMSALSTQGTSVDNTALALILQKSSGLLSSNDVDKEQCQVINNQQTACNYLNTVLCCTNSSSAEQENVLRCSGGKNVIQNNISSKLQACNLTGTSTLTADQISALTNKSVSDTKQESTGTSMLEIFLILILPLLIFGVTIGVTAKFFSNLMPFLGIIPFTIGVIMIIIYSTSSVIYLTTKNKSLSNSDGKCKFNNYDGDISISYDNAYDKCAKDSKCIAVDFMYNTEKFKTDTSNNKGNPFDILGSAVYYDNAEECNVDSESDDTTSYTFYKKVRCY